MRIPDCACLDVQILGSKRNLDQRSFFSLGRYVNEFIYIISFFERSSLNSGVRLLLELHCVIVIKHAAFLTICAKLTRAFTFTSLPLKFYTSVSGCCCGFGFEQKFWRIDGFGAKRHGSADLDTPIHLPLNTLWIKSNALKRFLGFKTVNITFRLGKFCQVKFTV